jgi:two-component system response regulator YesN
MASILARRKMLVRLVCYLLCAIFITVLTTGLLMYHYMNSTLREEAYESNVEYLKQTSSLVDVILGEVQKTAFAFAINRDVGRWLSSGQIPNENYESEKNIVQLFLEKINATNYIHSIYLYNGSQSRVISESGLVDYASFWDPRLSEQFLPMKTNIFWSEPSIIQMPEGKSNGVISFVIKLPINGSSTLGLIVINIKSNDLFLSVINSKHQMGKVMIYNGLGKLVFLQNPSLSQDTTTQVFELAASDDDGYKSLNLEGEPILMSHITSSQLKWKFVAINPLANVYAKSQVVLEITLVILGACLLFGFVLVLVVSGRVYSPIHRLLKSISSYTPNIHAQRTGIIDEIGYITQNFNSLILKNEEFAKKFEQTEMSLKNHFLYNLVTNPSLESKDIQKQLAYYDIPLQSANMVVAVMNLSSLQVKEGLSEQEKNIVRYQIYATCEQLINPSEQGIIIDRDFQYFVFIIHVPDQLEEVHAVTDYTKRLLADLQERVYGMTNISVSFGIGGCYGKLTQIHLSYSEAMETLIYERLSGEGSIISIHDVMRISPDRVRLQKYHSLENEMITEIKLGNIHKVNQLFQVYFNENQINGMSLKYKEMILLRFLGQINMLILEQDMDISAMKGYQADLYQEFAQLSSIVQIGEWFMELLKLTAAYFHEKRLYKNHELIEKVNLYIESQFAEPITLQMIADHVYLNTNYFCKVYKDVTGKTFNEYVTEVRLQKACELLDNNQGLQVAIVSELAGFGNKQNMIRAFKKNLGMTPSDYRTMANSMKIKPI